MRIQFGKYLIWFGVLALLCAQTLHSTVQFAKNTGFRCNQCHVDRNVRRGSIPKLKDKAFTYLTKLIQMEGYVPKINYRELTYLNQKIQENRKNGGKAPKAIITLSQINNNQPTEAKQIDSIPDPNQAPAATQEAPAQQQPVATTPKKEEPRKAREVKKEEKKEDKKEEKKEEKKEVAKAEESPVSAANLQAASKYLEKLNRASVEKSQTEIIGKKIKLKDGNTFILKRKNVRKAGEYVWMEDWDFDEY